jgi:hemoglobin
MRRFVAVVLLTLGLGACATLGEPERSLYQRLGGREGIALVVGDFVANMAGDARVNARFKELKGPQLEKLKSHLADQICDAAGGPCAYLGRDMKTTHKGMGVSETEWNATVENLVKALDKRGVPAKEQSELLSLLGPMKGDIVGQ